MKPARHDQPWTQEELNRLVWLWETHTLEEIGAQLGRTPRAVRDRAKRVLGSAQRRWETLRALAKRSGYHESELAAAAKIMRVKTRRRSSIGWYGLTERDAERILHFLAHRKCIAELAAEWPVCRKTVQEAVTALGIKLPRKDVKRYRRCLTPAEVAKVRQFIESRHGPMDGKTVGDVALELGLSRYTGYKRAKVLGIPQLRVERGPMANVRLTPEEEAILRADLLPRADRANDNAAAPRCLPPLASSLAAASAQSRATWTRVSV